MKYKELYIIIILVGLTIELFAQKHKLDLIYGQAKSGFIDMTGNAMGLGYEYKIKDRINLFTSISQSNMNGSINIAAQFSGISVLGIDQVHYGIKDLYDLDKNNNLQVPNSGVFPKSSFMSNFSFDIGSKFYVIKTDKLGFFIDARAAISKIEVSTFTKSFDVLLNGEDYWFSKFNNPVYTIILNTPNKDNFLDIGAGFGMGIDYQVSDNINLGFNPSILLYKFAAQNRIFLTFNLSYNL